jgi:hypothetical protein
LWPFQSSKALVATLCVLTVMSVLWVLVAVLWLDLSAWALTLAGCLAGSMYFGPCHLLPARMTINTRNDARHFIDKFDQMILRMGYVTHDPIDGRGHVHYLSKWHGKLWGWAAWQEQEVDLRWSGHKIEMRGPVIVVEWLRYRLLTERVD